MLKLCMLPHGRIALLALVVFHVIQALDILGRFSNIADIFPTTFITDQLIAHIIVSSLSSFASPILTS